MVCDNPRCDIEREGFSLEPAFGYYLTKGEYHEMTYGGKIPRTYACSIQCISPAIEAQIESQNL
jgi:hypothetical protein